MWGGGGGRSGLYISVIVTTGGTKFYNEIKYDFTQLEIRLSVDSTT